MGGCVGVSTVSDRGHESGSSASRSKVVSGCGVGAKEWPGARDSGVNIDIRSLLLAMGIVPVLSRPRRSDPNTGAARSCMSKCVSKLLL